MPLSGGTYLHIRAEAIVYDLAKQFLPNACLNGYKQEVVQFVRNNTIPPPVEVFFFFFVFFGTERRLNRKCYVFG